MRRTSTGRRGAGRTSTLPRGRTWTGRMRTCGAGARRALDEHARMGSLREGRQVVDARTGRPRATALVEDAAARQRAVVAERRLDPEQKRARERRGDVPVAVVAAQVVALELAFGSSHRFLSVVV